MSIESIQHVTIVGVGLLGGSAALAIKAHDPRIRVAGVGRRQSSLDAALRVGAGHAWDNWARSAPPRETNPTTAP